MSTQQRGFIFVSLLLILAIIALQAWAKDAESCSTDTECMAQCEATDTECDGGPQ